jgi:hypothetical protein
MEEYEQAYFEEDRWGRPELASDWFNDELGNRWNR